MDTIFNSIIAFVAGFALGIVFFGGLWLTIKKTMVTKLSILLFFGSFILRTAITLVGLYFIASTDWQNLFICLLGFVIARHMVNYLIKLKSKPFKLSDRNEVKS